jgi:hypothetical protein
MLNWSSVTNFSLNALDCEISKQRDRQVDSSPLASGKHCCSKGGFDAGYGSKTLSHMRSSDDILQGWITGRGDQFLVPEART